VVLLNIRPIYHFVVCPPYVLLVNNQEVNNVKMFFIYKLKFVMNMVLYNLGSLIVIMMGKILK